MGRGLSLSAADNASVDLTGLWRGLDPNVADRHGTQATQIFEMNLKRVGDTDWPLAGQAKAPQH
jgi:hypothetical protein